MSISHHPRVVKIAKILGVALAVLIVVIVIMVITKTVRTPDHEVIDEEQKGTKRVVTVEVDDDKRLNGVFDDVVDDLNEDTLYRVRIECSTGAHEDAPNLLATGTYAGGDSAGSWGMAPYEREFDGERDAECPVE